MKSLHMVAFVLLIVGGLAWGLHALGYDVVEALVPGLAKLVYLLVGLAALYEILTHKGNCKACSVGKM